MKERIIQYIQETYRVKVERPWDRYPDNITFKDVLSDKWFALILPIERSRVEGEERVRRSDSNSQCYLQAEYPPDEMVNLINVKADSEFIWMVSGTPGYLPGYHMNKNHWLSIYLDGTVPFEEICACIDTSYQLVTDTPTKRIYEAVKRIPAGCVATYAQVAEMAGNPKMCRAVGNALHKNPDPEHIPCFRVVNAKGELAGGFAFGGAEVQAELLRKDGVEVVDGRVDLERFALKL